MSAPAPVCRADKAYATAKLSASTIAFCIVVFLASCVVLWEANTVATCWRAQAKNVSDAIAHVANTCEDPSVSQAERALRSETDTCRTARATKMAGFVRLTVGCIVRDHIASAGHCSDIPLCESLAAWIDTFRKTFFLIVIAVILALVYSLAQMWRAEKRVLRQFLDVRKVLSDSTQRERALDEGLPAPGAIRMKEE